MKGQRLDVGSNVILLGKRHRKIVDTGTIISVAEVCDDWGRLSDWRVRVQCKLYGLRALRTISPATSWNALGAWYCFSTPMSRKGRSYNPHVRIRPADTAQITSLDAEIATDRTCHACGRECEPSPYGPPWCGRCAGEAYAEQLEDAAVSSDDPMRHRRLRRAGTVPVAGENVRPRKRAGGMFDTGD